MWVVSNLGFETLNIVWNLLFVICDFYKARARALADAVRLRKVLKGAKRQKSPTGPVRVSNRRDFN